MLLAKLTSPQHGVAVVLQRTEEGWMHSFSYRVAQKWQSFWYALNSSNINRFTILFHYQNQEKICNNNVTKDPTTP